MTVFITGGAGFIGSHLANKCTQKGLNTCAFDNLSSGQKDFLDEGVDLIEGDIRDKELLSEVIEEKSPDYIVHTAALHFIPYCRRNKQETFDVNIHGTENILDVVSETETSLEKFILCSSGAVYEPSTEIHSEDSGIGPIDVYGVTKVTNEHQLDKFSHDTSIDSISVRLFNGYGPHETTSHLIPEIIEQYKEGNREIQLGNLHTKRSFIYVEDIANALLKFVAEYEDQQESHEIFNLGSKEEYNAREVVEIMSEVLDENIYPNSVRDKQRESDRPRLHPNLSKIEERLGWKEDYDMEEGLRNMLAYYLSDYEK